MKPRLQVVTLAVNDLERSLKFYREGLGLESPGVFGSEFVGDEKKPGGAVAMFQLYGSLSDTKTSPGVGEERQESIRMSSSRHQLRITCKYLAPDE
jgi:catechol 2,3-dioxygenase-like lactoylglutathione lyase family enzyme